jgi:hypothetical protein
MPQATEPRAAIDQGVATALIPQLDGPGPSVEVGVHDASRLAWNVTARLPSSGQLRHAFELELEVPTNLAAIRDPWAALQAYARLDGVEESAGVAEPSLSAFQRSVASISSKLTRAGDSFSQLCTQIRSAPVVGQESWSHLRLWLQAATAELARARSGLLPKAPQPQEAILANEFLSLKQWGVLTYCARVLAETRVACEERGYSSTRGFEAVEAALVEALAEEMRCRRQAGFEVVEAASAAQLERLLARMGSFKKHFERVLFLDVDSYEIGNRISGWLSALMAMLAYLWFFVWQVTLERHQMALGSGVVMFALLTAIAYASRERLKEVGRSWLAGRVQRMFAQRVTRYRVPAQDHKAAGTVVVSARESFSQSSAQRPDPVYPEGDITREVTLLRFSHSGKLTSPAGLEAGSAREIRFVYRLDLSPIFPRLHDAVRGLATIDPQTGKLAIIDVSRNYELPLRVTLAQADASHDLRWAVILNKNGLVRVEKRALPAG